MRHIKSGGRLYICNQDITNKIFTDFVDRESFVIGSDCSEALVRYHNHIADGDGMLIIGLIPFHTSAQELLQNRWKTLVADSPDEILFSSGMRLLINWDDSRSRYHWSDQEKKHLLDQLALIGISEFLSVNDC